MYNRMNDGDPRERENDHASTRERTPKTRRMILLFHFRYPAFSPNFTISPTLTHRLCLLALALVNIR